MSKRSTSRKHKRVVTTPPEQAPHRDGETTLPTPDMLEPISPRSTPSGAPARPRAKPSDNRGLIFGIAVALVAVIALILAGGGGGETPSSPTQPQDTPAAAQDGSFAGIDRTDVQQLMRRGKELYDQNNFEGAASVYQEAIRLQPNNQAAFSNLGSTYFRLQKIDEALSSFQKAVDLNPNDAEARQNLGAGLAAMGSFDAAIAQYLQAIALKPDLAPAHYSLGVLYHEQGKNDKAIPELKRYLELGSDPQLVNDAHTRLKALGAE